MKYLFISIIKSQREKNWPQARKISSEKCEELFEIKVYSKSTNKEELYQLLEFDLGI